MMQQGEIMSNFTGKGSKHRPHDKNRFNDEFDRIFGKKSPALETEAGATESSGDKSTENPGNGGLLLGSQGGSDRNDTSGDNVQ